MVACGVSATRWWDRQAGYADAGDHIGGRTHLLEQERPGDRVALVGVGGGVRFGCAVMEALGQLGWGPGMGCPGHD